MRTVRWRCPEWWVLGISGLAWMGILAGHVPLPGEHQPVPALLFWCSASAAQAVAAGLSHSGSGLLGDILPPWEGPLVSQWVDWCLMAAAMMPALALGAIRVTAARSLWTRRDRAIAWFLGAYLGLWAFVGAIAILALMLTGIAQSENAHFIAAAMFAAAGLWQLTPLKNWSLRACHRTSPLAPTGWRADVDCARYGFMIGRSCLLSCWAMMGGCLLAGHAPWLMFAVTGVGFAERAMLKPRPKAMAVAVAGLGAVLTVAA